MNKLGGGVVGVLVIAAAGVVGASYWSGLQAERWYEAALATTAESGSVKLSTVRYQRGLFSSDIVTRVAIDPAEGSASSDLSFSIRQQVYHGPLPLAGWGTPDVPMHWTGAVVRATLDPDSSDWTRQLAKWYGSQEPVLALSKIAFDGSSTTQITMPPLTLKEVEGLQSLNYSGLRGQFQVGAKNTAAQGHLTIASLEAVSKPKAASEGQPATSDGQVKLRDLTMTVDQRQGPFNLLFGESTFKIAELHIQDQTSASPFAMSGLSVIAALTQQNPQQVTGELRVQAEKITVDQQSGTGNLHLALRNLDGATVEKLQQWQQKAAHQPDSPQAQSELLALMKTLLTSKPEFVLDTQAKMTKGDWQGQLTLNFQDFNEAEAAQTPLGLLGALEKGVADVAASKTLVESILTEQMLGELQSQADEQEQPVDLPTLQSKAATQANQQLQGLVAAGFVKLNGDRYTATVQFANGKLLVNGQEIPFTAPAEPEVPQGEIPMEPNGTVEKPAQP